MRAKTSDFLKVLNRARPDAEKKEMKTISYVASAQLVVFDIISQICAHQGVKTFIEDEQGPTAGLKLISFDRGVCLFGC